MHFFIETASNFYLHLCEKPQNTVNSLFSKQGTETQRCTCTVLCSPVNEWMNRHNLPLYLIRLMPDQKSILSTPRCGMQRGGGSSFTACVHVLWAHFPLLTIFWDKNLTVRDGKYTICLEWPLGHVFLSLLYDVRYCCDTHSFTYIYTVH